MDWCNRVTIREDRLLQLAIRTGRAVEWCEQDRGWHVVPA